MEKIKRLKVLKLFLLLLAILIVGPVVVFNKQIPAFIYNELEWQERARFLLAEEIGNQIDYLIGIRTGTVSEVLVPDQEKAELWKPIEEGLDFKTKMIEEYTKYLNWQDKIPFLPAKYEQYQELKKPAIENYQKSHQLFSEVKEKEHQGYRLVQQLETASQKVGTTGGENQDWGEYFVSLKQAAEVAETIKADAEALYQDGVIDEGFKSYVQAQAQRIIDVYQFLTDPQNTNDKTAYQRFIAILEKGSDQDFNQIITDWHKNKLDQLNQETQKYRTLAYEQITEADTHYRENDLKNDLITKLLSKITQKYPRNI